MALSTTSPTRSGRRPSRTVALALSIVGVLALAQAAGAAAGTASVRAGTAEVDGSPAEWEAADEVADLVTGAEPDRARARVSLRYDCDSATLHALVVGVDGTRLHTADPAEAFLRIDTDPKLVKGIDGDDGVPPDFAWVDHDGASAAGFEASAPLAAPAPGDLRVHVKIPDDSPDGYVVADVLGRYLPIDLGCDPGAAAATATAADPAGTGAAATTGPGSGDPDGEGAGAGGRGLARTGLTVTLVAVVGGALLAAGTAVTGWTRRTANRHPG